LFGSLEIVCVACNLLITIRSYKMKTTLDLPDELMEEAMQLTDIKTKTEVIIVALQELIKKIKSQN
jgi:Arc/MetJ family transcription regulator